MYGRPSKRMRRIKPVARVGAVDLNVRYDIHSQKLNAGKPGNSSSDECYDILEGEVVFKTNKSNFYRNNNLHVLSCTNGMENGWSVAGVAVTGFSPRTDVYEQGFVIQVSGLTSIFNNSDKTINAGDNVYVSKSISAPTPTGVPRSKQLLQLTTVKGNGAQLLGMCAKGGAKQSTIDIVLHRGGSSRIPSSVATSSTASSAALSSSVLSGDNAVGEETIPRGENVKGIVSRQEGKEGEGEGDISKPTEEVEEGEENITQTPLTARFRAGASVAKPRAKKKSKSSK